MILKYHNHTLKKLLDFALNCLWLSLSSMYDPWVVAEYFVTAVVAVFLCPFWTATGSRQKY